jgi:hypothetical protein
LRVPAWVIGLFAISAFLGNVAQWVDRGDLKAAADETKAETDCRSKIIAYTDSLRIDLQIAEAVALLEKVGTDDDVVFNAAVVDATAAVADLKPAAKVRENATEICAKDPDFDVADIPRG